MESTLQEFIDYCATFYGEEGIYDMNASLEQIQHCCCFYITFMGHDFEGDTMDRERVRDLLIWKYGLSLDPTTEAEAEMYEDRRLEAKYGLCLQAM